MSGYPNKKTKNNVEQRLQDVVASLNGLIRYNGEILNNLKVSNNHLNSINSSLTQANDISKDSSNKLSEINKHTEEAGTDRKKNTAWNKITSYYTQQLHIAWSNAEKNQKSALLLGVQNFEFQKTNAGSINRLTQKLTGYQEGFEVVYDKLFAGLDIESYSLDRLGVAVKVAGGDTKKLYKELKKNTVGLRFSDKQLSNLSDTILYLNQNFGTSVDDLLKSLGALDDSLLDYGVLGIAPEIEEASLRLGGALGQGASDLGSKVIQAFTKGSGMINASILGISKEREAALSLKGDEGVQAAIDLAIAAGERSKKLIEDWVSVKGDSTFSLNQLAKVYGKEVLEASRFYDALQEKATKNNFKNVKDYIDSIKAQRKVQEDFTNTVENMKAQILSPFMEAVSNIYNTISEFFTKNEELKNLTIQIGRFITALVSFILTFKVLRVAYGFFRNLIIQVIKLFGIIKNFVSSLYSWVASKFKTFFDKPGKKVFEWFSKKFVNKAEQQVVKKAGQEVVKRVGTRVITYALGDVATALGAAITPFALLTTASLYDAGLIGNSHSSLWESRKIETTTRLNNVLERLETKEEKVRYLKSEYDYEMANYKSSQFGQVNELLLEVLEKLASENKISNEYLALISDSKDSIKVGSTGEL